MSACLLVGRGSATQSQLDSTLLSDSTDSTSAAVAVELTKARREDVGDERKLTEYLSICHGIDCTSRV
jgi:hypothetical protein